MNREPECGVANRASIRAAEEDELSDAPHAQDQDPDENVYPLVMSFDEEEDAIRKGTIFDAKTLSVWLMYNLIQKVEK